MESQQTINTRRKILNHVVCSILVECGFDNCEKQVLETLTEMIQAFIFEIGETSRNYCELSGRTEPILNDVVVALINLGIEIDGIDKYGKRLNRTVLPQLQQQTQSKQQNILTAGQKQPHPQHIPNHLPPFPDPHAYIRTATHKQPVTEYEAIREKAAARKRDTQRALTKFFAKTGDYRDNLFLTEDNVYQLIPCKPEFPSYLSALLPSDQVFETDPELEFGPSPVKKPKEQISNEDNSTNNNNNNSNNNKEDKLLSTTTTTTTTTAAATTTTATTTTTTSSSASSLKSKTDTLDAIEEETTTQQEIIDNPYLQPGKIPGRLSHIANNGSFHLQQYPKKELILD